jgi:hypothetical protein
VTWLEAAALRAKIGDFRNESFARLYRPGLDESQGIEQS